MTKKLFFIYVFYVWTKMLLGLTFYPLRFTRKVVRRPILFPVIFTPLMGLIILFIFGRIAALLISVYGINRQLIALFLSTVLLSVLFWQILLLYLLSSYFFAMWRKKVI